MWIALALWMLGSGPELVVHSDSGCPGAAAVAAEMAPLFPAGVRIAVADDRDAPGGDRAELTVSDGIRWVRLVDGDGRVVQQRPLPESIDCAEAARSAAVLLAAWEFQGRGDLFAPARAPAAVAPAARTATTAPVIAAAPSPRAPAPFRSALAVGLGVSLGAAGDSRPAGATAELVFGRPDGIAARALLAGSAGYSVPIGTGRATWYRIGAGLGASLSGRRGAWGAGAHAEVMGARLAIAGEDVSMQSGGSQLVLGVGGGVRALRAWGPARLWLDATVTWWPGEHQVVLVGTPEDSRTLPGLEATLGAGAHFFVWP